MAPEDVKSIKKGREKCLKLEFASNLLTVFPLCIVQPYLTNVFGNYFSTPYSYQRHIDRPHTGRNESGKPCRRTKFIKSNKQRRASRDTRRPRPLFVVYCFRFYHSLVYLFQMIKLSSLTAENEAKNFPQMEQLQKRTVFSMCTHTHTHMMLIPILQFP